ncbi:MAG TPA: Obg family GTPase CgtA, partial [Candidatus Hydrogenedentes bacterium]|nr:Obg family GTPase CgtA [Candidatus Hydrogenedentota bacterium]
QRIPQGFEVTGEGPVRAVNMTDFENDEAVEHLHRRLKKLGVLSALKRMGAAEGQTVRIGGVDLEYRPD